LARLARACYLHCAGFNKTYNIQTLRRKFRDALPLVSGAACGYNLSLIARGPADHKNSMRGFDWSNIRWREQVGAVSPFAVNYVEQKNMERNARFLRSPKRWRREFTSIVPATCDNLGVIAPN